MTKHEQIKQIRKASANRYYDKVMIAFRSNRKLRKQQPNLLNETRFHRDNYYDLIDKYSYSSHTLSEKLKKGNKYEKKDN